MIDSLRAITRRTQWLKLPAIILVIASTALFGYIILGSTGIASDDLYLIPSTVSLLWSIMACVFLFGFPHAPEKPNQSHGFFRRIIIRLQRFFYFGLAIVCLGLTGAVAFYSYKLLNIWLQSNN